MRYFQRRLLTFIEFRLPYYSDQSSILVKRASTCSFRREFAKFEAERQRIKMPSHSNPIFRQATTTVQNPAFNSNVYQLSSFHCHLEPEVGDHHLPRDEADEHLIQTNKQHMKNSQLRAKTQRCPRHKQSLSDNRFIKAFRQNNSAIISSPLNIGVIGEVM